MAPNSNVAMRWRPRVSARGQRAALMQRLRVPQSNRTIARSGQELRAVGAEFEMLDVLLVTAENQQLLESLSVPDPDGCIISTGGDSLSVGTEGRAVDLANVTLEAADRSHRRHCGSHRTELHHAPPSNLAPERSESRPRTGST